MFREYQRIYEKVKIGQEAVLKETAEDEIYYRKFIPKDRLILLGGGHVSLALERIAPMLDFSVTVVDDRPAFANVARFPDADEIVCDSFENALSDLKIRETDYVCVLTRGHRWDKACVTHILSGTMPYYLGMVGSKKRVKGLRETLLKEGFDQERTDALHAPIGISIGAITTAEIAVSILAELIACRRAKDTTDDVEYLHQTNTDMDMLRFLSEEGDAKAMLMVLSSSGSTPVKSGAMMAIDALGSSYGTIGGGCSEAAAMARARRIIGTKTKKIIEVDMSDDEAAENGMVCGGSMRVLIEDIYDTDEV